MGFHLSPREYDGFKGECISYTDNNQNGLVDEPGLYFTMLKTTVEFGLTLSRPTDNGVLIASGSRSLTLAN